MWDLPLTRHGVLEEPGAGRQHPASPGPNGVWTAHLTLAVCLVLIALPLMLADFPPIFDYPNHLSRAHVIANLDRSPVFATHFRTTSFLIPNVLADLVLLALLPLTGTLAAGKILLFLTVAATLTGAYALNRGLTGRFGVWPLFAALLVYNEGFFWGFLNYDLALGLLLWAMAAWLLLERRRRWQLAVGAVFALLIFLAHLVAFGLYAVAIAVVELRRVAVARMPTHAAVRRLTGSAAQFLLPVLLFFWASPSGTLNLAVDFDFSVFGKIMPLARLLSSCNPSMDIATAAATVGVVAGALATRHLAVHAAGVLIAGVYLLLVMTLPYTMLGSYFLDSRIGIAAALVLASAFHLRNGAGTADAGAAVIVVLLTAARSVGLVADWRSEDADYAKVLAALDTVPSGSVLVTAVGHAFELGDWVATRYVKPSHEHTAHYLTMRKDVLVPNIFARRGQNPLVFASPLEELNRVAYNPVARIFTGDDARRLFEQVGPIADAKDRASPRITGVYVVAYRVPCSRWPTDLKIRPLRCETGFSLVEILPPSRGGPVP